MLPLLLQAAKVALPTNETDHRNFWLGAIGIRQDGARVSGKNGAAEYFNTVESYELAPNSHAEGRVLRKLGKRGIIFVARVSRKDRSLAMARPCGMCQIRIRAAKIRKVYYTINDYQYGIWFPDSDTDKIYTVKGQYEG